ncbi:MAG TPA: recombination protein RecR [Flavobacteriales bacterium]|nr:recombination protein RecR [Flavobacteriales bacterium]|tara:strand:+ start:30018 stop:30629 length:612 start_codon:yes stop_codon:yes gene_type:complete
MQQLSSKIVNKAVASFSSLPGIGEKTALRLVLHLLRKDKEDIVSFASSIEQLLDLHYCSKCYNLSDTDICEICANPNRDEAKICVVEDLLDVIAIENTTQFNGYYHVLGGVISPIDGIGPNDLRINELIERIENSNTEEVIMALSTTLEGDTTNFYLYKKLKNYPVKISTIARGVGIGDEINYTDEVTLGKSIVNRIPFEKTL